jgi:uncharacterized protein
MIKKGLLTAFCLLITCPLSGQEAQYPQYTGYVNDFAGLLSPEVEARLNGIIGELERKTTAQVAVVTVESTGDEPIEQYAVKLFKKWGIGQKGKDNGVLILVAAKDQKIRIEVGYGLEGAIPDAVAFAIYKKIMVPHFRSGDFDKGVSLATEAVVGQIAEEYGVEIPNISSHSYIREAARTSSGRRLWQVLLPLIFFFGIFFLRLWFLPFLMMGAGRRRGGYWYGGGVGMGGGYSGGFGGFGGGMSGGGGAGGGW